MQHKKKIKKKGFTVIELVVVIAIITIVMPVVFGLFFVNLQAHRKLFVLSEVKENGDYALSVMESLIRGSAAKIVDDYKSGAPTEYCSEAIGLSPTPTPASEINFKDRFGEGLKFGALNNKIASYSSTYLTPAPTIAPANLTNSNVVITNLEFSCVRVSSFGSPLVSISFIVSDKGSSTRHEEKAQLKYQTKVKLRSF